MHTEAIHILGEHTSFEDLYIAVRKKEKRLYSDEELKFLPDIRQDHPHYKEWLVRKNSANRLKKYIRGKDKQLHILEVGCGNGWLSAYLSDISSIQITAIDINKAELIQAKKVFRRLLNVNYILTGLDDKNLLPGAYDLVIFAASIQYFKSVADTISKCLNLLKPSGEIHIIDSFFYTKPEAESAGIRSRDYYRSIGYSSLSDYYYHHTIDTLSGFNHQLIKPGFSLFRKHEVFPWIKIMN